MLILLIPIINNLYQLDGAESLIYRNVKTVFYPGPQYIRGSLWGRDKNK